MLSCSFLKKLSPATIQRDYQSILQLASSCPFASRLFGRANLNFSQNCTMASVAVEQPEPQPPVCKDVSECLLRKCPYSPVRYVKADEEQSETSSKSLDYCTGSPDSNCNHVPHSDMNGLFIPQTCALFVGWKAALERSKTSESTDKSTPVSAPPVSDTERVSLDNAVGQRNFDYTAFYKSEIAKKKKDATYRVFRRVLRDANEFPFADEYTTGTRQRVAIWCSNDYLGMSWHPKVQEAAISAIKRYGVGSGGTRNISGNSILHEALEAELADLHDKPSALVFTSCYVCNEAALYTLGTRLPGVTVLSDAGNHASMIHGIRTSRAPKRIFRHNDYNHLAELLTDIPAESPKMVVFETVHSMTGDVCPLKELLDVSEQHNALTFVDEVHGVGLYGARGAGVAERDGVMHRIDAITGTLGKAFASIGGYLAGGRDLVDMIRSYASGFIFTTSLPPPTLAAARASIEVLRSGEGKELRTEHQRRVHTVRSRLQAEGIPVIDAPSHILPVHVGDAELCTRISEELLVEHHIYVQSINYPTVNRGDERLRIAPTPHHTDLLTDQLVDSLCSVWRKYDLPFAKRRAVGS